MPRRRQQPSQARAQMDESTPPASPVPSTGLLADVHRGLRRIAHTGHFGDSGLPISRIVESALQLVNEKAPPEEQLQRAVLMVEQNFDSFEMLRVVGPGKRQVGSDAVQATSSVRGLNLKNVQDARLAEDKTLPTTETVDDRKFIVTSSRVIGEAIYSAVAAKFRLEGDADMDADDEGGDLTPKKLFTTDDLAIDEHTSGARDVQRLLGAESRAIVGKVLSKLAKEGQFLTKGDKNNTRGGKPTYALTAQRGAQPQVEAQPHGSSPSKEPASRRQRRSHAPLRDEVGMRVALSPPTLLQGRLQIRGETQQGSTVNESKVSDVTPTRRESSTAAEMNDEVGATPTQGEASAVPEMDEGGSSKFMTPNERTHTQDRIYLNSAEVFSTFTTLLSLTSADVGRVAAEIHQVLEQNRRLAFDALHGKRGAAEERLKIHGSEEGKPHNVPRGDLASSSKWEKFFDIRAVAARDSPRPRSTHMHPEMGSERVPTPAIHAQLVARVDEFETSSKLGILKASVLKAAALLAETAIKRIPAPTGNMTAEELALISIERHHSDEVLAFSCALSDVTATVSRRHEEQGRAFQALKDSTERPHIYLNLEIDQLNAAMKPGMTAMLEKCPLEVVKVVTLDDYAEAGAQVAPTLTETVSVIVTRKAKLFSKLFGKKSINGSGGLSPTEDTETAAAEAKKNKRKIGNGLFAVAGRSMPRIRSAGWNTGGETEASLFQALIHMAFRTPKVAIDHAAWTGDCAPPRTALKWLKNIAKSQFTKIRAYYDRQPWLHALIYFDNANIQLSQTDQRSNNKVGHDETAAGVVNSHFDEQLGPDDESEYPSERPEWVCITPGEFYAMAFDDLSQNRRAATHRKRLPDVTFDVQVLGTIASKITMPRTAGEEKEGGAEYHFRRYNFLNPKEVLQYIPELRVGACSDDLLAPVDVSRSEREVLQEAQRNFDMGSLLNGMNARFSDAKDPRRRNLPKYHRRHLERQEVDNPTANERTRTAGVPALNEDEMLTTGAAKVMFKTLKLSSYGKPSGEPSATWVYGETGKKDTTGRPVYIVDDLSVERLLSVRYLYAQNLLAGFKDDTAADQGLKEARLAWGWDLEHDRLHQAMHMSHCALRLLYTLGVSDVKTLLEHTDIQVESPIKLFRRKLELLNIGRLCMWDAMADAFIDSEHYPISGEEEEPITAAVLMDAWDRFTAAGLATGDAQFQTCLRYLEITQSLFLFMDESRHGAWQIPELLEHEWIALFECTNKKKYAFSTALSRVQCYGRSARLNEVMRRSRTINMIGREMEDGACEFFGAAQEQHVHQLKQSAARSNSVAQFSQAAGYAAVLSHIRRMSYLFTGHLIPRTMHMPGTIARERLKVSTLLKQAKVGVASAERESYGRALDLESPLASVARCEALRVVSPESVKETLRYVCIAPRGTNGYPILETSSDGRSFGADAAADLNGNELVGFTPGRPDLKRGLRMSICLYGAWPETRGLRSAAARVDLSDILLGTGSQRKDTITFEVDLPTSKNCGILDVDDAGLIKTIVPGSIVDDLGLQSSLARVVAIGGNKLNASRAMTFDALMKFRLGAEGSKYRTFTFEVKPEDLKAYTLWYHKKGARVQNFGRLTSNDGRQGTQLSTGQQRDEAAMEISQRDQHAADVASDDARDVLSRDAIANVSRVIIDTSRETGGVSVYQSSKHAEPVRASKQDTKAVNGIMAKRGGRIFEIASETKGEKVMQSMSKRHLGTDTRTMETLLEIFKGTKRPPIASRVLSAGNFKVYVRRDEQLRRILSEYDDLLHEQSAVRSRLLALVQATPALQRANRVEIEKANQQLEALYRDLHQKQLTALGLIESKAKLLYEAQQGTSPAGTQGDETDAEVADRVAQSENAPLDPDEIFARNGDRGDSDVEEDEVADESGVGDSGAHEGDAESDEEAEGSGESAHSSRSQSNASNGDDEEEEVGEHAAGSLRGRLGNFFAELTMRHMW